MPRNVKFDELKRFAEIILSTNDYKVLKMKMNGFRTGLNNKNINKRRKDAFKKLIDVYV